MKQAESFLQKIHSLPEEARRFLALLSMAVAAIMVFNGSLWMISSRLQTLSETSAVTFNENPAEVQYPAAPKHAEEDMPVSRQDTPSIFGQIGGSATAFGASVIAGAEKIWAYATEPFQ